MDFIIDIYICIYIYVSTYSRRKVAEGSITWQCVYEITGIYSF
jgi:hypothetical protein